MKEKNQLISRIKTLREEVFRLEKRVIILKAMLQTGEAELKRRKKITEGAAVPLVVESK